MVDRSATTTISEFFENDHRDIDQLVTSLLRDLGMARDSQSVQVGPLVARLEEIDRRLERHIIWEEDLLFPAVERAEPHLREGPGAVMRAEHADIRDHKERSLDHLRNAEIGLAIQELETAVDILTDHNQKEELIYYPTADQLLAADDARRLLALARGGRK